MTAIDYEKEYDNRGRVPEHPALFARRDTLAKAYRAASPKAELDISYGPSPRQKYDLFPAVVAKAPLAMFIHGGYWIAGERAMYSHVAKGLNGNGVSTAIVGYDLCPTVTLAAIIEEMRAAVLALWRRYHARVMVFGHSAGGHLAACMVATDFSTLASDAPADLVPAAYAISGIYDMAPLLNVSQNQVLKLDAKSAYDTSPIHWHVKAGRKFDAVVGGIESAEFLRQSKIIAEQWKKAGLEIRYEAVPGMNHFTVAEPLDDPASAMTRRVAELAKGAAALPL
jgi:arylformamidase